MKSLSTLPTLVALAATSFTCGFAESLDATEIYGVGLDQVGIELMLADQLAEAVADLGAAVVSVPSIDRLGWEFLRLAGGESRFGKGADFLDRADADAVGLPQGPVDRSSLGNTHLSAMDQRRDVGRIGIAVADETLACAGFEYRRLEGPARSLSVAELGDRFNVNSGTARSPRRDADESFFAIAEMVSPTNVESKGRVTKSVSSFDPRRCVRPRGTQGGMFIEAIFGRLHCPELTTNREDDCIRQHQE